MPIWPIRMDLIVHGSSVLKRIIYLGVQKFFLPYFTFRCQREPSSFFQRHLLPLPFLSLNSKCVPTYIIFGIQMAYLTKPFEIQANSNSLVCWQCQAHSRKCTELVWDKPYSYNFLRVFMNFLRNKTEYYSVQPCSKCL